MFVNPNPLVALNLNNDLDFFTTYNREYVDPHLDDDPYFGLQISSAFCDINSLSSSNFIKNLPLYISINIQSLQSKFEQFKSELIEFEKNGIQIDIVAIQETWEIKYP
jgi:hypothetical protein